MPSSCRRDGRKRNKNTVDVKVATEKTKITYEKPIMEKQKEDCAMTEETYESLMIRAANKMKGDLFSKLKEIEDSAIEKEAERERRAKERERLSQENYEELNRLAKEKIDSLDAIINENSRKVKEECFAETKRVETALNVFSKRVGVALDEIRKEIGILTSTERAELKMPKMPKNRIDTIEEQIKKHFERHKKTGGFLAGDNDSLGETKEVTR